MFDILKKIYEKFQMTLLLRNQHKSERLRNIFRTRYNIDVGMQSYGCFDQWRMTGPMKVGRYCSIAKTARTALNNHPTNALTTHPILYERRFGVIARDHQWSGEITISDDVWIGHHAVILPGCRNIGRGAVIGAGAIVTRDVHPYTIVAGNPAKVIRMRFDAELAEAIERSRWWELDPSELQALIVDHPALLWHPTTGALDAWCQERGL